MKFYERSSTYASNSTQRPRQGVLKRIIAKAWCVSWMNCNCSATDVSTVSRRHRLSVAYITLSVERQLPSFPASEQTVNSMGSGMLESSEEEAVGAIVS